MNKGLVSNLIWKILERFGVQGVQFVLQIILARILAPEYYGVLSIMLIFTALAEVFVQRGFNTALIQNKDVTEEDYSSVLWVSLGIASVLYGVIYFTAPLIAGFYEMPELISPLRVLALILFPGALNSVQLAKVSREMDFKKVFFSNVAAIVVSGGVGIAVAYAGGGLWALVVQNMLNVFVACVVMKFTVKLHLKLKCNWERIKILFRFGWKLLVSSLIDTLYQDMRSLVIGKKYNSETLGFYNRGKQFPQFIINAINGSVQSVMLPALSSYQDDSVKIKDMMRKSIMMSSYIMFPIMAGLAGVAAPLVSLLLTDKWLPCVPYLQVYCFSLAFYPVHSCNLQAINAMGRSDMFLKLEIIKKSYGLVALIIAVIFFDSPLAIALTGAITTVLSCFVNAAPNKKLVGYSYWEQLADILPSLLLSIVMLAAVLALGQLPLSPMLTMLIQMAVGVVVYVGLSLLTRVKPFMLVIETVKGLKGRKKA